MHIVSCADVAPVLYVDDLLVHYVILRIKSVCTWKIIRFERLSPSHGVCIEMIVVTRKATRICSPSLQVGQKVNDLYEDLRDGSRLLMLIELFTGEKLVPNMGMRHCTYYYTVALEGCFRMMYIAHRIGMRD